MRYNKLILSTIFALLLSGAAVAQDTVDAIRYNINLDLGHRNANAFCGHTDVYLTTTQPTVSQVQLDLQGATVDSVMIDGTRTTDYTYAGRFLTFPTPSAAMQGDTVCVTVYYHGDTAFFGLAAHGLQFDLPQSTDGDFGPFRDSFIRLFARQSIDGCFSGADVLGSQTASNPKTG